MNIRKYHGTLNLGDAIQTIALARLLPEFGFADLSQCSLVNGWLGHDVPASDNRILFAGIHLANKSEQWLRWIKQTASGPVGARDPITLETLQRHDIAAEFCGCAALTLPRYEGERTGELHIDDESKLCLTNTIPNDMPWHRQWNEATRLLANIKTAAKVFTCRLHVVLPCLAMGTPVFYHDPEPVDSYGDGLINRFSILEEMGMSRHHLDGAPDITKWSNLYKTFLKENTINSQSAY